MWKKVRPPQKAAKKFFMKMYILLIASIHIEIHICIHMKHVQCDDFFAD